MNRMYKRFWIATAALLAYMALWIWPLLILVDTVPDDQMDNAVIAAFFVIAGSIVLFMDWCTKIVFRFHGVGTPVSEAALRTELLAVNLKDTPIIAEEKNGTIIFTWKYHDEKWSQVLSRSRLQEAFKVTVRLDGTRHRVTMLDTAGSVQWGLGANVAHVQWNFFRGVFLKYQIDKIWGLRENYMLRPAATYAFSTEHLHNPVMNTILRCGWDVRFGLF